MLHRGRHAAPRLRRSVLLPTVLLLGSGSALTGLAVLPVTAAPAAASGSRTTPAASSAPQHTSALLTEVDVRAVQQERSARVAAEAARARVAAQAAARVKAAAAARSAAALRASRARRAAAPPVVQRPEFVRPGAGRLTSHYGQRWGRLHAGIDLAAGIGSPVVAVADGVVLSAGSESGYGRCVRVQHGNGTVSLYGHLSQLLVAAGQPVSAGTLLGREGSSGHSTGPHLHFEIRVGDVPVDPLPWLRERGIDV